MNNWNNHYALHQYLDRLISENKEYIKLNNRRKGRNKNILFREDIDKDNLQLQFRIKWLEEQQQNLRNTIASMLLEK